MGLHSFSFFALVFRSLLSAYCFLLLFAPFPCILEHLDPRGRLEPIIQVPGHPCPLPFEEGPFGVRHHRQMSPIRGAESCYPKRGPVRVKRVALRNLPIHPALVIHEDQRKKLPVDDFFHQRRVRGVKPSLAMRHPNPEHGTGHASQHDCRAFRNLHGHPA